MSNQDRRGYYKRSICPVHGRGHRYPKTEEEIVEFPDHTETRSIKVCECGDKKVLKTQNERKIQGRATGEKCLNPWKKKCSNSNIAISIVVKGETLPICGQCWEQIADSDKVW